MKMPDWINSDTLTDTINYPGKEVWIEEHKNPITNELLYLVCESCVESKVFNNFIDASNNIGIEFGFNEFWLKL